MSKFFRCIAVIMIRLAGIVFIIVALGMLWKSVGICGNLADCLAPTAQLDITVWRLIGLFLLNLLALLFDWCIAATIIVIAVGMILYKTETLDKISSMEI